MPTLSFPCTVSQFEVGPIFLCFYLFPLLLLKEDPLLVIVQPLFPLDILEHVLVFWQDHVVGEHFAELLIELEHAWESLHCLLLFVESLQKLAYIIKDQVVFEHRDDICVFVVDYVVYELDIVVLSACQVLSFEIFVNYLLPVLVSLQD